jgi:hypothetical protein
MPLIFSNRQLFDAYLVLKPLGRKYLTTEALKKELQSKGYGELSPTGFTFTKYAPKYSIIASYYEKHQELPPYHYYLRENRIGAKYRVIDLTITLFLISFMGTCSYYTAKTMHKMNPTKHYRSSQ